MTSFYSVQNGDFYPSDCWSQLYWIPNAASLVTYYHNFVIFFFYHYFLSTRSCTPTELLRRNTQSQRHSHSFATFIWRLYLLDLCYLLFWVLSLDSKTKQTQVVSCRETFTNPFYFPMYCTSKLYFVWHWFQKILFGKGNEISIWKYLLRHYYFPNLHHPVSFPSPYNISQLGIP